MTWTSMLGAMGGYSPKAGAGTGLLGRVGTGVEAMGQKLMDNQGMMQLGNSMMAASQSGGSWSDWLAQGGMEAFGLIGADRKAMHERQAAGQARRASRHGGLY